MSSFKKKNANQNANQNINQNINQNANQNTNQNKLNNTIIINNKRIKYYKYHHDLILPNEKILDIYKITYQNYISSLQ